MKALFWLLVAANAIFFIASGWMAADSVRGAHLKTVVADGGPGLVLVGERPSTAARNNGLTPPSTQKKEAAPPPAAERATRMATAPVERKPAPASNPGPCFVIGPFTESVDATSAVMQLKERSLPAKVRSQQEQVAKGYWVFVPPLATREEAKQVLRQLQINSIDSFIVTKGNKTNALSVGIYGELSAAEARRDELRAKGFEVELEERASASTEFWVQVPVDADKDTLNEIEKALAGGASGKRLERGLCQ